MAINYEELERELRSMKPRSRLFILIKQELTNRGHWKNKKRGKPTTENLKQ